MVSSSLTVAAEKELDIFLRGRIQYAIYLPSYHCCYSITLSTTPTDSLQSSQSSCSLQLSIRV